MVEPRVLIVGTVPYNKKSTSRAFESYFANWKKENLAQVFSNTKKPARGHCGRLYQITDQRLIKRRFDRKIKTGKQFIYEELNDEWADNSLELDSDVYTKMYKFGSKKTPIKFLIRKLIWKKKLWNTKEFNAWLDEFQPEAVFLSFSNDFFILQIALYIAQKYDIPIISSTGDDYYFNDRFSLSPFYYIYRRKYKRLVDKVFAYPGDIIYISDKIRDKYNDYFKREGKTLYLTSGISRRPFRPVALPPSISYFGNIRGGRNESLVDLANAIAKIDNTYKIDVFSNEHVEKIIAPLLKTPAISFHKSISYKAVQEKLLNSDIALIVEGFKKKHILSTKYSLSTKVADCLGSGVNILTYGSAQCGAIEYMQDTKSSLVITERENITSALRAWFDDIEAQKRYYHQSEKIFKQNHILKTNADFFESIVRNAVANYQKKERQK